MTTEEKLEKELSQTQNLMFFEYLFIVLFFVLTWFIVQSVGDKVNTLDRKVDKILELQGKPNENHLPKR